METNSETEFSLNNTNTELVDEIQIQSLEIELSDPSNADFSCLKADGLSEIEIA